jgi:16S rRNA (guanine1207-N2)-methyltransferase
MSVRDRTRLNNRPDTRDDDAAEVILGVLEADPPAQLLVAGDRTGRVADRLSPLGVETHVWSRRAVGRQEARAWPEATGLSAATLRMPRSKPELEMSLHALAGCVASGGEITVYGANDEGIKSAGKRMKELLEDVETVDSRRHCRVWRGRVPADRSPLRTRAADWEQRQLLALPVGDETREVEFLSYPGCFAKGGLDPASAALLQALPTPQPGARVLDFACGIGVLARGIAERQPELELQLVDADALSTTAARANIAGAPAPAGKTAKVATGDGWRAAPVYRRYDFIVSNPPIHTGKGRDYRVLTELVETANRRLLPKGSLWIVVQRQVPLRDMLDANFDDVSVAWEDTRFRVWRCGRLEDRLDI